MRWTYCFIIGLIVVSPVGAQPQEKPAATQVSAAETKAVTNVSPGPPSCGCELPLPEVVAVVHGVKITKRDFSPETNKQIMQLQEQVVAARRRELELQINSLLLEAEASRLKLKTHQLLENEVVANAATPTEADAQAFYNENKTRIKGEFPAIKNEIVDFLLEQRQRDGARKLAERLRLANNVQVLVTEPTPPVNPGDDQRLFATVNGVRITSSEIEQSLAPLIFNMQEQVYALLKTDLDQRINEILLTNEAQKRQVTTRALVDAEITAKVPLITEKQAQAFYDGNKEKIKDDFAKVKADIIQYLTERETRSLQVSFAGRLRQAAPAQIFLSPPVAPVLKISIDNQPEKGNRNAPVTIIEFADFQCASCAQTQTVVEKLLLEYGDRVRLVVRDFPLSQHKSALKAAEAAEAARSQGKYWDYVALLYANQSALEIEHLKNYATQVGLDRARFDAALDGGAFADAVLRDVRDGYRAGVTDTPSFFINGRRVADGSYSGLKAAIEATLTDQRPR